MKKNLITAACAAVLACSASIAANAAELRLSHQWSTKDVRHQVAQMVADD